MNSELFEGGRFYRRVREGTRRKVQSKEDEIKLWLHYLHPHRRFMRGSFPVWERSDGDIVTISLGDMDAILVKNCIKIFDIFSSAFLRVICG
jgi:hypothetical protein